MKKALVIIITLITLFVLAIAIPAFAADGNGIPLDILKQGGLNDASFGGGQVVSPFIKIINYAIGILSAIFLGYAILHLVLKSKDLISGKKNWKDMLDDFVAIGISVIVLAISLAGAWYDLINWFQINVISKILGAFR